ncbi:MAG TPA: serine--tRNA ligase [candidate division Zixibacteria bacterium]|nr:serine--tRNA ligase [candidate division Zixibacteria bacterium]HPI32583.1 serine--tRNA ligase [candidate division Zixibacteria bacterium]HPM38724.1 serine--tRNA ligase [candidate division Zixibacteria bacterium]
MLDLKFIRENPEAVKAGIAKKNDRSDIDALLAVDARRRDTISRTEALKAERNRVTADIARKKKAHEPADDLVAEMRRVGDQIVQLDADLRAVEDDLQTRLSWIPNLPHESVPVGGEADMKIVRRWGDLPAPAFPVRPHWEIGEQLGILDIAAATKVSGAGFYALRGLGARLERALIAYMLDTHAAGGFCEHAAPYLVTEETMFGTGQLPKMTEDMYRTEDNMWLIPTAEVSLTNLFRQEILDYRRLPILVVGHSPCFRREAGAAGKDTRGMIRVHQFHKVEMVKIVRPETSYDELESLVAQAEKILQGLRIPYRVGLLASADLSFAAAKCYDIELWAAGIERWLEISSCSNFEDFQARRMNCRFRDEDKKVRFPHTLNGSGLALARLVPAILENYQNADGSVTVPEVLRPYMGGLARIG